MSNSVQLFLTIVTFVLGTITFGSNYISPLYNKVDAINHRLYQVEAQLQSTSPNIPKRGNATYDK